ncbi:PadR family transcriptional regulator [Candidatus Bathyarchaeota archaeon]|nr:PadR family transcriptional regulator [Candidatus Bathyarchaeota archaeon]
MNLKEMTQDSKAANSGLSIDAIENRIVKEFLDIIILLELKDKGELSGYDIAVLQHKKFNFSLSPGTVYATLYAMERRGLIEGHNDTKKTVFHLTEKGGASLENLKRIAPELIDFTKCLFPV